MCISCMKANKVKEPSLKVYAATLATISTIVEVPLSDFGEIFQISWLRLSYHYYAWNLQDITAKVRPCSSPHGLHSFQNVSMKCCVAVFEWFSSICSCSFLPFAPGVFAARAFRAFFISHRILITLSILLRSTWNFDPIFLRYYRFIEIFFCKCKIV